MSRAACGIPFFPFFSRVKPAQKILFIGALTSGMMQEMATEYILALVGLIPCILALAALIWALLRRQIRGEDQEMYAALAGDEIDYTTSPSQSRGGGWLVLTLIVVFSLIGWMVIQTVITARNVARSANLTPQATSNFTEKKE